MNPSNKYIQVMLATVAMITLFHFSILLKVIPYDITWGWRLTNDTQMYVFESISIIVNLFLMFILMMKWWYIKRFLSSRSIKVILWMFMILFILNTIWNIFAQTHFEKIFTWVTAMFAFCIWKILWIKN